jgi:hypothetical protein
MYPQVPRKYTYPTLQAELMRVWCHLDQLASDESISEEDSQKWLLGRDFIHFMMTHDKGALLFDFLLYGKRMDFDEGARILVQLLASQTTDQEDGEQ